MLTRLILIIRALLFFLGYITLIVVWASVSLLVGWCLPYKMRFRFVIVVWSRAVLFWLRCVCGVHIRVHGAENIPARGCLVLCKHESTMETLFLQSLLVPSATVIKRELLYMPFFGWAFMLLKPIAINRTKPNIAFREVMRQGRARLADGIFVLLFPEGSRTAPGVLGEFYRGGAALALAAQTKVMPVVHNAGQCWPGGTFLKYPGVVDFVIGEPVETLGKTAREVNDNVRTWMQTEMHRWQPRPE